MSTQILVLGALVPLPLLVLLAAFEVLAVFACISLIREARAKYATLIPAASSSRRLIHGTVVQESSVVAPLSGRACVASFVRVFASPTGPNSRRLELAQCAQRLAAPFKVLSAGGVRVRVILEPDYRALTDYPSDFVRKVRDLDGLDLAARNRFRALPSYHTIDGANYPIEFWEYRVEAGKPVVIAGEIEADSEDATLRIRNAHFAPGTLEEVRRIYRRALWLRVCLWSFLIALLPAFLVIGIPVLDSRLPAEWRGHPGPREPYLRP